MWLALTLAMAGPPDGVDPDDLDRWEGLSQAVLDGPDGCWDFSGTIQVNASMRSRASFFRRTDETPYTTGGTWSGRFEDGKWTSFRYKLQEALPMAVPPFPVIGEIAQGAVVDESENDGNAMVTVSQGDESKSISLVRQAVRGVEGRTGTSIAQWVEDRREIELSEEIDSTFGKPLYRTTLFEEGAWPSRLSVRFPAKIGVGSFPFKVSFTASQVHLVQRKLSGHVFPAAENMSTVFNGVGFTIGYEQRLDYLSASPCR